MHCRTVLSYQAVYGGYAVMVGDGRYPGTDASVRDEASGKMRLNSTELAAVELPLNVSVNLAASGQAPEERAVAAAMAPRSVAVHELAAGQ